MLKSFLKICMMSCLPILVVGCATSTGYSPRVTSELQQGQRYFEQGYYKKAMQDLLPLACDGNPQAQYAVGYMYYYGYGVAQDTDVGYFWIKRSADQHYEPAVKAIRLMSQEKDQRFRPKDLYR